MNHAEDTPRARRVFAFTAPRGGVGKSTVVHQVGRLLTQGADEGWRPRVLLVDFDSSPGGLGSLVTTKRIGGTGWLELLAQTLDAKDEDWLRTLERLEPHAPEGSIVRCESNVAGGGGSLAASAGDARLLSQQRDIALYYLPAVSMATSDLGDSTSTSAQPNLRHHSASLRRWLERLTSSAATEQRQQRLSAVRANLCRHFDYVLLDLQAGVDALEQGQALFSPDVAVVLFRPAASQLADAATLALTTYLRTQSRDLAFVPVVPLLVQRPATADAGLDLLRRACRSDVFPWLAERSEIHGPPLHELPFDSGAAVAINPITEQAAWDPLADPSAPFTIALARFVATLREMNAAVDPIGADSVTNRALSHGDLAYAVRFLSAALKADPAELKRWRSFGESFAWYADESVSVRAALADLAASCPLQSERFPADARCYAHLWNAVAHRAQHATKSRRELDALAAWSHTQKLRPRVRADLLKWVVIAHAARGRDGDSTELGGADPAVQRLRLLAESIGGMASVAPSACEWTADEARLDLAEALYSYARRWQVNLDLARKAYVDAIRLDASRNLTARATARLGELLAQHHLEAAALSAFRHAMARTSDITHEVWGLGFRFLGDTAPQAQLFAAIEEYPLQEEHDERRAQALLRTALAADEIASAITALRADNDEVSASLATAIARAILRDSTGDIGERINTVVAALPSWSRWQMRLRAVREFASWIERRQQYSSDVLEWARQIDPARQMVGGDPRVIVLASGDLAVFREILTTVPDKALPVESLAWRMLRHVELGSPLEELSPWQKLRLHRAGLPSALARIYAELRDDERGKRLDCLGLSGASVRTTISIEPDEGMLHDLDRIEGSTPHEVAAHWIDRLNGADNAQSLSST